MTDVPSVAVWIVPPVSWCCCAGAALEGFEPIALLADALDVDARVARTLREHRLEGGLLHLEHLVSSVHAYSGPQPALRCAALR